MHHFKIRKSLVYGYTPKVQIPIMSTFSRTLNLWVGLVDFWSDLWGFYNDKYTLEEKLPLQKVTNLHGSNAITGVQNFN